MDIKQMIAYVQIYIHIRKGKEVNINIENNRDIVLLHRAYNCALNWFEQNNVKISVR